MHTLVLCLSVLGIVSAADEQSERPAYIISQHGSPPGYSNGQPFFEAPVSSSVKVLPNAYKTSQGFDQSGANAISVPVIVNNNTPFQGNTNQPIPVPVAYSDDGSALTGQSQPASGTNPISIQGPPYPGVTPIPVLVKAPALAYRTVGPTPRPFQARNPQVAHESTSENPYSALSPSFRLWPKLPEPVPVPVLTTDAFLRNSYRNLNSNLAPQKFPVKAPDFSPNQQNPILVKFPDNSQIQTQSGQPANQGPIYIIVPGVNNNAQSGSYQAPTQTQASYQSQAPQTGNQRFIIIAPPSPNSQSNQGYQNDGYSLNQYFGNRLQEQSGQQPPLNFGVFGSSNAPGTQYQAQSGQQAPLKYAIYGPTNAPGSFANPAGQNLQNYAVFGPANAPESQSPNTAGQFPLNYNLFGYSNSGSSFSSSTPSPPQYFGYSPTQSPSPQYTGYSSTPSPSPQYIGYPSTLSSPQYSGYVSSTTPSPSQNNYSQSTPVSRVSFSGAGNSYSYSIK